MMDVLGRALKGSDVKAPALLLTATSQDLALVSLDLVEPGGTYWRALRFAVMIPDRAEGKRLELLQ
jgi:hypothetical protein